MSVIRTAMKRKGFTLIEILVVIVIIGVLSIIGVSKYTEFTTSSRGSGCIANQTTIDKTVGVWESQNVAIPSAAADLTFDTNGIITKATNLNKLAAGAGQELKASSDVIFQLTKDSNVFVCPERANVVGSLELIHGTKKEENYKWQIATTNQAALRNKQRGTICTNYGATGPDGTTDTIHR